MAAKIPYMPEGSTAVEMAKQWTPQMQERIRLWGRGTRISPTYDRSASINGGKSWARLQSQRNYNQNGVSSDTFNNFTKTTIKVNFENSYYVMNRFILDVEWRKIGHWGQDIGRDPDAPAGT